MHYTMQHCIHLHVHHALFVSTCFIFVCVNTRPMAMNYPRSFRKRPPLNMTERHSSARKSFLDLPVELRHMIYGSLVDIDPLHQQLLKTIYEPQRDCILHWAQKQYVNAAVSQLIASLRTMGVISKAAHYDARSFFYASTDILFYGDGIKNLRYFGFLHRLLQTMGPGGAASLCSTQFES